MHGGDPYNVPQTRQEYLAGGGNPRNAPESVALAFDYPPPALPLFALTSWARWRTALRLWLGLNLIAWAIAAWAITRLVGPSPGYCYVAVVYGLLLWACSAAISIGQPVVIAGSLTICSILGAWRNRPVTSAVLLGVAAAAKPTVALVAILAFLLEGRWKTLIIGGIVTLAATAAVILPSWPRSSNWLPEQVHMLASLPALSPLSTGIDPQRLINFQTVVGLFTASIAVANRVTYAIVILVFVAGFFAVRRSESSLRPRIALGVALPAAMLVTYHRYNDLFVLLLILPLCLFLYEHRRPKLFALFAGAVAILSLATQTKLARIFSPNLRNHTLAEKLRVLVLFRHQPLLLLALALMTIYIAGQDWTTMEAPAPK
jgi:hypothetical protein